jgi:hypothetical protein
MVLVYMEIYGIDSVTPSFVIYVSKHHHQVCLFCAQFFDPEYPGGIFYPRKVLPQVSMYMYVCIYMSIRIYIYSCIFINLYIHIHHQEKSSGGVLAAISSHNSSYDPAKESKRLKEEEREIEASLSSKHPSRAPSAAASRTSTASLGMFIKYLCYILQNFLRNISY